MYHQPRYAQRSGETGGDTYYDGCGRVGREIDLSTRGSTGVLVEVLPRLSARRHSRERVPRGRKACQTFGAPKMMRPQQLLVFILLGTHRRVFWGESCLSYPLRSRVPLSPSSLRLPEYGARSSCMAVGSVPLVPFHRGSAFLSHRRRETLLSCDAPRQLRATPRAVLSRMPPDTFLSLALAFRLQVSIRPSRCTRAPPVVTRTRLVSSATASLCVSSAHRDKPLDLGIYSRQPPKQVGCLRKSYFDTGRIGVIWYLSPV